MTNAYAISRLKTMIEGLNCIAMNEYTEALTMGIKALEATEMIALAIGDKEFIFYTDANGQHADIVKRGKEVTR